MNRDKLEHLLKNHHREAFMWASQCCGYNSEEAKEVLQMTYLKIFEGKAIYQEMSEFKTWLFSVIRFTAIDHINASVSFRSIEHEQIIDEIQAPDEINYKQLLSQLPERQHQILLLAFYHGMTLAAIAEVTELHIGTVRTHYERGKKAMREIILKEKYEKLRQSY